MSQFLAKYTAGEPHCLLWQAHSGQPEEGFQPLRTLPAFPEAFWVGASVFTTFLYRGRQAIEHRASVQDSLHRLLHQAPLFGLEPLGTTPAVWHSLNQIFEQDALLKKALAETKGLVLRLTTFATHFSLESSYKPEGEGTLEPSTWWLSVRGAAPEWPAEPPPAKIKAHLAKYQHPLTMLKHGSLAGSLALRRQLAAHGEEVLWVNPEGYITEATTSNCLWIDAEGCLWVSPSGVALAGVTQQQILRLAEQLAIPVTYRMPLALRWQQQAQGLFLSNAVQGLQAVEAIDGYRLPWGGPSWQTWQRLYTHWRLGLAVE